MSTSTILEDLAWEHTARASAEPALHRALAFCPCAAAWDYRMMKHRYQMFNVLGDLHRAFEATCEAGREGVAPAQAIQVRERARVVLNLIRGGA